MTMIHTRITLLSIILTCVDSRRLAEVSSSVDDEERQYDDGEQRRELAVDEWCKFHCNLCWLLQYHLMYSHLMLVLLSLAIATSCTYLTSHALIFSIYSSSQMSIGIVNSVYKTVVRTISIDSPVVDASPTYHPQKYTQHRKHVVMKC